jgi:hypothetical protein
MEKISRPLRQGLTPPSANQSPGRYFLNRRALHGSCRGPEPLCRSERSEVSLFGKVPLPRAEHHWARVLENGLRLASATGANPEVVTLFALGWRLLDDGP